MPWCMSYWAVADLPFLVLGELGASRGRPMKASTQLLNTMNKHTPGPWVVHCMTDDAPMTVPELNGHPEFQFQHWTVGESREGSRIARIEWYSRTWGFGSPSHEESVANFRLILTAPELLEACVAALALLCDPDADGIAADKVESVLRSVISKSKGQA